VVTRVTVRGSAIRKVCVEIMGEVVFAIIKFHPTPTSVEIPVHINMMRLGYHCARIQVEGLDVDVTITYKLLSLVYNLYDCSEWIRESTPSCVGWMSHSLGLYVLLNYLFNPPLV